MDSKKHLLILGADSDIAIAAAERFACEGWKLTLASRRRERTENLCLELSEKYGTEADYIYFDALNTASFISEYRERNVQTNGLLAAHAVAEPAANSVKMGALASQNNQRVRDCHKVIQTNFISLVEILETVKHDPSLKHGGFICAISSVAGLRGRASNAIYGSSKAALNSYMSGLRNELAGNTHVITVMQGYVNTKMLKKRTPTWLTASPGQAADAIFRGIQRKKEVFYVKRVWYFIMLIIRLIPEKLFKRMNL